MKVETLAYKPVGLLGAVAAGAISGMLFSRLWRFTSGEKEAPHATDESRGWPEILAAAAMQGAIFAIVKAAIDRGSARAFRRVTSRWPG